MHPDYVYAIFNTNLNLVKILFEKDDPAFAKALENKAFREAFENNDIKALKEIIIEQDKKQTKELAAQVMHETFKCKLKTPATPLTFTATSAAYASSSASASALLSSSVSNAPHTPSADYKRQQEDVAIKSEQQNSKRLSLNSSYSSATSKP